MSKLTVIVPFRDESGLIESAVAATRQFIDRGWEIVWVNDGSRDQGPAILRELIGDSEALVSTTGVGIFGAVKEGAAHARHPVILVLPIDCRLSELGENFLPEKIRRGVAWGAFRKGYANAAMPAYASIQNRFLLPRAVVAWTNAFVLPKALLDDTGELEFPQDLRLSRLLRKRRKFQVLPGKVEVSPRKYDADGRPLRIFQNLLVVISYSLGLPGPVLQALYRTRFLLRVVATGLFLLLCSVTFCDLTASTSQRPPPKRFAPADPVQRSQKAAEAWVFGFPRSGVFVHSVLASGSEIRVEGSYSSEQGLEAFAKKLSGDGHREVKTEKVTRTTTMGVGRDYVITVENKF